MLERYTQEARRVVFFARHEANRQNKSTVEPKHLVLGIIYERPSFLNGLMSSDELINSIKESLLEGEKQLEPTFIIRLPLSHESKLILAQAAVLADSFQHRWVDIGHILLAVLEKDESETANILLRFMSRFKVRDKVSMKGEPFLPPQKPTETVFSGLMSGGELILPAEVVRALDLKDGDVLKFTFDSQHSEKGAKLTKSLLAQVRLKTKIKRGLKK